MSSSTGTMGSYEFKISKPEASEVYVTGDFDDWKKSIQLFKHADGMFRNKVDIPHPTDRHFYKYVVDDKWVIDEAAPTEPDPNGNINNVLKPEDISKPLSTTAKAAIATAAGATIATVGAGATTLGLAGNVPKEDKADGMPGTFPSETANEEGKSASPSSPDVDFFPGDEVPDYSKYSSNSVKSTARDGQTFGVSPLPATSGTGNPVQLKPGEPVPPSENYTTNTTTSNVKLDKESYEKSDAYPGGVSGASGAAQDPTIQSSGAGTSTAALAGNVPKEPTDATSTDKDNDQSTLGKAAAGGAAFAATGAAAVASYLGFGGKSTDTEAVKAEEDTKVSTVDANTTTTKSADLPDEPKIHDENTAPAIVAAGSPGVLPSSNDTDPSTSKGVDATNVGASDHSKAAGGAMAGGLLAGGAAGAAATSGPLSEPSANEMGAATENDTAGASSSKTPGPTEFEPISSKTGASSSNVFADDPVSAPGYTASKEVQQTPSNVAAFKSDPVSPEGQYGITAPKDAGAITVGMREGQITNTQITPKSDALKTGGEQRKADSGSGRGREESRELSPMSKPQGGSSSKPVQQQTATGTQGGSQTLSKEEKKKKRGSFIQRIKSKLSSKDKDKA